MGTTWSQDMMPGRPHREPGSTESSILKLWRVSRAWLEACIDISKVWGLLNEIMAGYTIWFRKQKTKGCISSSFWQCEILESCSELSFLSVKVPSGASISQLIFFHPHFAIEWSGISKRKLCIPTHSCCKTWMMASSQNGRSHHAHLKQSSTMIWNLMPRFMT